MDYAGNLALFLQEKTGSIFGRYMGKMSAKEQRELFGQFIGKGTIVIDGQFETLQHQRAVCHWAGQDYDTNFYKNWKEL